MVVFSWLLVFCQANPSNTLPRSYDPRYLTQSPQLVSFCKNFRHTFLDSMISITRIRWTRVDNFYGRKSFTAVGKTHERNWNWPSSIWRIMFSHTALLQTVCDDLSVSILILHQFRHRLKCCRIYRCGYDFGQRSRKPKVIRSDGYYIYWGWKSEKLTYANWISPQKGSPTLIFIWAEVQQIALSVMVKCIANYAVDETPQKAQNLRKYPYNERIPSAKTGVL